MGKYRKRFNEKARSGMLAKQAALRKARNKQFTRHENEGSDEEETKEETIPTVETQDSNAEILKPMTEEEKQERKRKLEETLYSENSKETKMSRSKKKRLDKYINHQLKREEKKVLLEKLSQTKVDSSMYAPSKLLGTGKQTKKEQLIEALELERQGRGDENTRDVLYEERVVKDWEDEPENFPMSTAAQEDAYDEDSKSSEFPETKSSFIDYRPAKFGGSGTGFGFTGLQKIEKSAVPKKKYSWRLKVEQEEKKRAKIEDDEDFMSDEDEEEEEEEEEAEVEEEEEDGDELEEEEEEEDEEEEENQEGEEVEADSEVETGDVDEEADSDSDSDSEDDSDSEEDSEEESEEEDEDTPRLLQNKPKHSKVAESFKEWAEQQVRKLEGRETEMLQPELSEELKQQLSVPTMHEEDFDHSSDEENYVPININLKREAFFVHVNRPDEIQQLRMQLPVFGAEHRIMEAIYHHDCIVICGETGSGKTTQVPQFLYEAGFGNPKSPLHPGMIGVTQPRRVAAVSMAERIGNELGDHGHRVGYQIRFDNTIKNEGGENGTAMKFMTDGVLLREMMSDFLLTKYSAIVIDEAHERNVNTDILIGMLSRILKLRREYHRKNPEKFTVLKLIIMSATLRVSDFSENKLLFKNPPPILKVDARQYPVSVHFNRRTKHDYLEEAFRKTCKIHKKLPPGGILVFLTGQNEITALVKKLRGEFPMKSKKVYEDDSVSVKVNAKDVDVEAEDIDFSVNVNDEEEQDDYDEEDEEDEEEEGFDEVREEHQTDKDPLYVLPLYSLLPTKEQMKVFDAPPKGSRLCIIATNVAETSLTIPGVRYVVDCGRSKERKFNEETGVQSFEIDWVSKASADQRSGRAGRTGPGHCYRLFSSAVYENDFQQFSKPEILRMPVESVILNMKSIGIDQIMNFPFPTHPDRTALKKAERLLTILGALHQEEKVISDLGRHMSLFPLSPRFAKILIVGNQQGCLPYVIAIVAGLSVGDPFINEHELGIAEQIKRPTDDDEEEEDTPKETYQELEAKKKLRGKFHQSRALFSKLDKFSDVLQLLSAVCAYDHVPVSKRDEFLKNNFLRPKVMEEIAKLRKQLTHIVKVNTSKDGVAAVVNDSSLKVPIPNKTQVAALKQIISSGFIDQVAIRGDLISSDVQITNRTSIMNTPYETLFPSAQFGDEVEPFVFIHPNSIINSSGSLPAPYLVYQSLNLGSNRQEGKLSKLRIKPLVDIGGKPLANIAKNSPLITYSKPLGHPYAPKNITPTKRECYVVPRFGAAIGDGGVGWDLPAIKVIQEKKNGQWVISK